MLALINRTPDDVIFHRLTGTASSDVLLAPLWCSKKWQVLNAITAALAKQVRQIDTDETEDTMACFPISENLAFSAV